jgi:preprotein translocase subunit SecG
MGVKQTTDVLEKGTWIFAAVIGVLCLASTFFISGSAGTTAKEADAPATGQGQFPPSGSPATTPPAPNK